MQFSKLIEQASLSGLSFNDFINMHPYEYKAYTNGYIQKRENSINDSLFINHISAAKLAQAVWGSKDYKKTTKNIKLTDSTELACDKSLISVSGLDSNMVQNILKKLDEDRKIEINNQKVINTLKEKGVI